MNEFLINQSISKLFNNNSENYIFIYSPPKVGSTTLVTSLRISLGTHYNIIHIHDEIMLSVLTGINNIKINDIINFLSRKGKNVYVIDVYRTPIERKMSEYFEKLSPYHFNNAEENLLNYSLKRIIDRFNKIFPYLENNDHYLDVYNIENPIPFDFNQKYTLQEINRIKYIKLRLCDSQLWGSILSIIFNKEVVIIPDYKTEDKKIGTLYKNFKSNYKLPKNYIELIKQSKSFIFYYSELERKQYLELWSKKLDEDFIPYTEAEYNFYIKLCIENQYINDIQSEHYIDNGCSCRLCSNKRREIFLKAKSGEKNTEKIIHKDLLNENKVEKLKEISKIINNNRIDTKKIIQNQFKINILQAK
jgi:hypothetical protein